MSVVSLRAARVAMPVPVLAVNAALALAKLIMLCPLGAVTPSKGSRLWSCRPHPRCGHADFH